MRPIWVDLEAPSEEEKRWIAERFSLALPEDIVDDDLEESARFYEEDNGELHIRSDFLIDGDDAEGRPARNVRVAFILFNNVLFSIHNEDLPVFRLLRLRARRIPALIEDAKDVLLKLYDAENIQLTRWRLATWRRNDSNRLTTKRRRRAGAIARGKI